MSDGQGFRPTKGTTPRGPGTTPTTSPSGTRPQRGTNRGRSGGRRPPGAVAQSAQSAASVSAPGALTLLSKAAGTTDPVPHEEGGDSRGSESRKRSAVTVNHWGGGHTPEPEAAPATATLAPPDAGAAPAVAAAARCGFVVLNAAYLRPTVPSCASSPALAGDTNAAARTRLRVRILCAMRGRGGCGSG